MDKGSSTLGQLTRASQPTHHITTIPTKKKRSVIVIVDFLLKEMDGLICHPDPTHRDVCCLPGAQVRGIAQKITHLVCPSDYYPLLDFNGGSDDMAKRSPRVIKREFLALGQLVEGSGAQVVFSSILPVVVINIERNRRTQLINMWL